MSSEDLRTNQHTADKSSKSTDSPSVLTALILFTLHNTMETLIVNLFIGSVGTDVGGGVVGVVS